MARAREDRYQNAAEFQRDLQALRDRHNKPASLPPPAMNAAMNVKVPEAPRAPLARPKTAPAVTPPPLQDTERPPPPARNAKPPPAIPRPNPAPRKGPPPGADRTVREEPPPIMMRPPPRTREPTPSSVEIPITFSSDTPLSGENLPVEPTELGSSRHLDFDDETEVQVSPIAKHYEKAAAAAALPRPIEDDHTTQRRGPELSAQLANAGHGAPRPVYPSDSSAGDTEINTEISVKPGASARARKKLPSVPDDLETQIHSRNTFPLPKRPPRKPRPSNPDDTVKMTGDLEQRIQEARERLHESDRPSATLPRAPKR